MPLLPWIHALGLKKITLPSVQETSQPVDSTEPEDSSSAVRHGKHSETPRGMSRHLKLKQNLREQKKNT